MKTKEQKRQEAYDRLVERAQMDYENLLESEQEFPSISAVSYGHLVLIAKAASVRVWEFHHKYGYPLPDIKTFHNR